MLKIRFTRVGKKNAPSFRLVLIPKEKAPKGKSLEVLGFYNPITKEKDVKKDRIAHWLAVGAQTSDSAHNFLIKMGVIKGKKIAVHAKSKKKEEETAAVGVATNAPQEAPKAEAKTEIKEEVKTEPVVPVAEGPERSRGAEASAAPSAAEVTPAAMPAEVKTEAPAKEEAAVAASTSASNAANANVADANAAGAESARSEPVESVPVAETAPVAEKTAEPTVEPTESKA